MTLLSGGGELRVFSSTVCAYYESGDKVGKLLGWASLIPFLSAFFQLVHVYTRRELRSAMVLIGGVANQIISVSLKEIIQESRPRSCQAVQACKSFGMPSSHSQCISFVTAIYIMIILDRPAESALGRAVQRMQGAALVVACGLVAWSRVYLGYHTTMQVYVGLSLGVAFGLMWYAVMLRAARYFPSLVASPLCAALGMKDSSGIPDVVAFEYDNALHAQRGTGSQNQKKRE
mmetsp:Transcript_36370/g.65067  ORF Transcript_36370/g.65067 Transcript_36370/m.65067 type:complete len:232 (-) Transcript_36370:42-737(-)